jgi:hypothetical protein
MMMASVMTEVATSSQMGHPAARMMSSKLQILSGRRRVAANRILRLPRRIGCCMAPNQNGNDRRRLPGPHESGLWT